MEPSGQFSSHWWEQHLCWISSSLRGAQGLVPTRGLVTGDWFSCPHWGMLCYLRYPVSFPCRKVQVHVIPPSLMHKPQLPQGMQSTMHLCTSERADPWIFSNSNRSLKRIWDTYRELNLDADLSLIALTCAQLALAPCSLLAMPAASGTGCPAWLVRCHHAGSAAAGIPSAPCRSARHRIHRVPWQHKQPAEDARLVGGGEHGDEVITFGYHPGSQRRSKFTSNPIAKCKA